MQGEQRPVILKKNVRATCEDESESEIAVDNEMKRLREAIDETIRRCEANVNEASRQLKRTSSECGSWRVDVSNERLRWGGNIALCVIQSDPSFKELTRLR